MKEIHLCRKFIESEKPVLPRGHPHQASNFMIFGIIQKSIENDAVWTPDVGNDKIWAFDPITSIELAVEVHGGAVFT